jgi:hypothetical protein
MFLMYNIPPRFLCVIFHRVQPKPQAAQQPYMQRSKQPLNPTQSSPAGTNFISGGDSSSSSWHIPTSSNTPDFPAPGHTAGDSYKIMLPKMGAAPSMNNAPAGGQPVETKVRNFLGSYLRPVTPLPP